MEAEKFAQVIKDELAGVREALKTQVSDQVAGALTKTAEDIGSIKADLAKLQARGEAPDADKVKDLEARLLVSEKSVQEFAQRINGLAIAGAGAGADRANRDVALFKNRFLTDEAKLKQVLRELSFGGDTGTRAIDSSLFSTGGKLSAETADRFLDFVIEQQTALKRVVTRRMISPEGKTDELTLTARKLRKATEATAPTVAGAIGVKRRTLTTVEGIWAEDITLTFLEDNIEKAGAEAHIARMLATGLGNDLNDLAWNGDTAIDSTPNNFVETNNGWIALALADADVHDVNAGALSTPSNTDILSAMYRAIAFAFLARTDMLYFMPVPFCQRYAEEVAARETGLGDQVLVNGFPALRYFGIPVIPEPHLYLTSADMGMLTPSQNLYHGIQRNVTIDSEWIPRKRQVEYTLTVRNDYEYATGDAIVLMDAIPAGNR